MNTDWKRGLTEWNEGNKDGERENIFNHGLTRIYTDSGTGIYRRKQR
jgi:hypothetical protein